MMRRTIGWTAALVALVALAPEVPGALPWGLGAGVAFSEFRRRGQRAAA